MKSRIKYFFLISIIGQGSFAQCAMCKAVVESGDNQMAKGVNDGILYLMAMPYLILVVVGIVLLKYYIKKKV